MTPERIVAALLTAAVVLAWLRLGFWQYRAVSRAPLWRLAALILLQPVVAGLLYLSLFAPVQGRQGGTLVVATAGAPPLVPVGSDDTLVALPEASVAGARREPDLGTALRHHPDTRAIRIVGMGLVARDRPAAAMVDLRYDAPAPPGGLVALTVPEPVAPGERFTLSARIGGARIGGGATATLLDPAGRVVDSVKPAADGSVTLHGTARVAGEALFTLRLGDGTLAAVPLVTRSVATARAVIVSGAPGPEAKFLRRWATDAGLAPQAQIAVGGGVVLGGAPASYAGYDLAILDDRSWASLGSNGRGALAQAVRGGMGLVVRLTGPVPRGRQVLGLPVGGGSAVVPLRLPPLAPSYVALAARRGPGSRDAPASIAAPLGEVPDLSRMATTIGGVPLLRDARGTPYAAWRNVGRGRVAIVSLLDSFALVTSGNGDAHADIWSTLASTVGRGTAGDGMRIDALPWVGERMAICDMGAGGSVTAPDGGATPLIPDPAAGGCAGFWPTMAGWHRVGRRPFYVYPADALPQLRTAARRDATLALVGRRRTPTIAAPAGDTGPSLRWCIGFLIAAGLLWWLERRRPVRILE